jgi:hypothetical protein
MWIINLWDSSRTYETVRMQPPVIYLPQSNDPVAEIWFWHVEVERWFVMSRSFNLNAQRAGVVYFDPTVAGWKDRLRGVIRQFGGSDADGKRRPV